MSAILRCAAATVALCLVGGVYGNNGTAPDAGDACAPAEGPWSALLEQWATAPGVNSTRHGRIMALPPANGYYVTERIDGPFAPPPPPPGPPGRPGPHGPGPHGYSEWDGPQPLHSNGKIVNRPPAPYKDKFKPSYAPPTPSSAVVPGGVGGRPGRPGAADRVDTPPGKQVSETDLYLLGAIEKLVHRADLMEKRLRRLEENVHFLVAGADAKPEPCEGNFTRVGGGCYWWSGEAADWKGAAAACRRQRAVLLELAEPRQKRILISKLLADDDLRGVDFWTGGLNPGLLWIWSHSARPVAEGNSTAIPGTGRCLALGHDPATRTYLYRGRDCSAALRYVCQAVEDTARLSNDIERAARKLRADHRRAKLLWADAAPTDEVDNDHDR